MAKKISSKKSDQAELPLDATPAPEPKAEAKPAPVAPAVPAAGPAEASDAPKRKKGQKVQDDKAPLDAEQEEARVLAAWPTPWAKARGLVARWLCEHRISKIEDMKGFDTDGYRFDKAESEPDRWRFTRS